MFDTIRNAWKIADLRKKILFTALILLIFRIGSAIPVPFLDASVMQAWMSNAGDGNLLGYIDVLTGGAFSNATIFAMSTPFFVFFTIFRSPVSIKPQSPSKNSRADMPRTSS